ncbi:hypothetical protein BJJLLNOG_00037 [Ostreid herpesvirus 1]|nr:hypothetical protein LKIMDMGE_00037 [Ostreid herpesvirus 1]UPX72362.1 hypothetical protein AADDAKMG_00036 [Ostreid herpesvirus 1]UPX72521.1 hypothetical protein CEAEFCCE_00036 [Ostreid herpesvirus 1]UPX72682.1 hypothetical protein FJINLJCC_00037 [Ostreid herpesvirus 1]UPX72842.1 hypothetical protein KIOFAAIH_00035 [Ostreid herpesvirus 1]
MDDKTTLLLDSSISNSKHTMVSTSYPNLNFNFTTTTECATEPPDLESSCTKDF